MNAYLSVDKLRNLYDRTAVLAVGEFFKINFWGVKRKVFVHHRVLRDRELKIGVITMALERRGEPTEHGQLWRKGVARNLDMFSGWITVQRMRLEVLWQRLERAMARPDGREAEVGQSELEQEPAKQSGFTPEQCDRLLGRKRDVTDDRKPDRGNRKR